MATYMTWLADALRRGGLPVREIPGWKTRGHGAMNDQIAGVLAHHTAGPATGLYPSEGVVVNGRPGLAGPLANLGLDRAGTWIVVAAGQAWHAGTGSLPWCPANQGNSRLIGVEAESVGTRDDWTPAQREAYPRGVAALLSWLRLPATRVAGHKEWAPGRKVDPAFIDMNAFRADVARWMGTDPLTPFTPTGGPELDATERQMLEEVHRELTLKLPSRADYRLLGQPEPAQRPTDTLYGFALNADARSFEARELVRALATQVAGLRQLAESQQTAVETLARMAGQGGGSSADQIKAAVTEALQQNVVRVDVAVAGRSA